MSPKILLDNPSAHPGLGFEKYASALKDIVEQSDPQFSVGIFGGWGSGKTTLMRAIEKELSDKIVAVWFNAWRYEKEEHLIIPLLDAIRDALVTWATDPKTDPSFRDKAIKAASTITKAARAIFAGLAVKAKLPLIEVSLDANKTVAEWRDSSNEKDRQDAESPQSPYHASFKALQESLTEFIQHGKQRIIVFVDDLDRCLPSNALQVLESMKLFFDLEGFVFVVGLDQKVIEAAINWNYRFSNISEGSKAGPPISGADYIKKLFQVPFNLPVISSSQLDGYLSAIFSSAGRQDEDQRKLLERVRPHLDFLVDDSGVNPREVKRYINAYILQKLIQPGLDDEVTLVLQTIAFRSDWRDAYQIFRSSPDTFVEASKRELAGEKGALKDLDSRLESLPESFFRYIESKGGQKLLNLDAPQLDEQIRTFDVTQPPERLASILDRRLITVIELMNAIDPLDLADARKVVGQLRREIRDIEENIQKSGLLGSEDKNISSEALDDVRESMTALRNGSDSLAFAVRQGNDMQADEFNRFLEQRAIMSKEIERLRRALNYLGNRAQGLPSA